MCGVHASGSVHPAITAPVLRVASRTTRWMRGERLVADHRYVDVEVAGAVAGEEPVAMGMDHEGWHAGDGGGNGGSRRSAFDAGVGNERHVRHVTQSVADPGGGTEPVGEGIDEPGVNAVQGDHDMIHPSPRRNQQYGNVRVGEHVASHGRPSGRAGPVTS